MGLRVDSIVLVSELLLILGAVTLIAFFPTRHCLHFEDHLMQETCADEDSQGFASAYDIFEIVTANGSNGTDADIFLEELVIAHQHSVCNLIPHKEVMAENSKFYMGWVAYLLLANYVIAVCRLISTKLLRTRIANAAATLVTLVILIVSIYFIRLDHRQLERSQHEMVQLLGAAPSTVVSVLPWNWNWAKIISVFMFILKVIQFIINHANKDVKLTGEMPIVKMFDFSADYASLTH